jgi:hypothetical protein
MIMLYPWKCRMHADVMYRCCECDGSVTVSLISPLRTVWTWAVLLMFQRYMLLPCSGLRWVQWVTGLTYLQGKGRTGASPLTLSTDFDPEDGGRIYFWNVSITACIHTMQRPKRRIIWPVQNLIDDFFNFVLFWISLHLASYMCCIYIAHHRSLILKIKFHQF